MGFFKKLFKRKKGGTAVGNWLRMQVHKRTGGLFGADQEAIDQFKMLDRPWNEGEGSLSGHVGDWLGK